MCLGIPGEIIERLDDQGLGPRARVRFGSVIKDIELSLVPEAQVGEFVIVHVGFAISQLDPELAQQTLKDIEQVLTGAPVREETLKTSGDESTAKKTVAEDL